MNPPGVDAGLCGHCLHCRLVETRSTPLRASRSVFYLCKRSFTDPSYRKYPPLPVRTCQGFEEGRPNRDSGEAYRTK